MINFLEKLLGRLPIGWLQLVHKRGRFLAAIAGVAFANILIFMQLGFLSALENSTLLPYKLLDTDIIISSSDSNTISDGSSVPRQRLYQALSVAGIESYSLLYLKKLEWMTDDGNSINLQVFGVNPFNSLLSADQDLVRSLAIVDNAIIDTKTRNIPKNLFNEISVTNPFSMELNKRTINIVGSFESGAGFEADGNLITSDMTFLKLFNGAKQNVPKHILLKIDRKYNKDQVVENIRKVVNSRDIRVNTIEDAMIHDKKFQTTKRPVGIIFGFGVIIGVIVGIIIVYQVLSSDVADHMKEYATFKAIGYSDKFFTSIILEEAIILAVIGFVPGILISSILYYVASSVTGLPISMNFTRPIAILFGTALMCLISGMLATRKLKAADPADLF